MYLQFMDSATVAICHLNFSYWLLNIKHHTKFCSHIHMYSNKCCKTWCDCLSNNLYADFETTIPNAVRTVWPGCELKTCRFHLGQKWWSKIQFLGLSTQYRKKERKKQTNKDSWVSQFLKKIFGLPLLPPAQVNDCFAFDFVSNLRKDKRRN